MDSLIQIKLEVGGRVVGFCHAHPSDNPGLNAAVVKLEDRLTRARVLDQQHESGQIAVKASVLTKGGLRATVRDGLILVAGLAEAAAAEQPDLVVRIKVPKDKMSRAEFVTKARVAVAEATEVEPLLKQYGLPDTLLAEITAAIDRIEATESAKEVGRNSQVGASADLDKVTAEVMRLLRQLDRLNRHRFRDDAELLAAWVRARNIPLPSHDKPEVKPAPKVA
jgi:hypothetical protein